MLKKFASGFLAGHCRLTISAAFTSVPRFIQRAVRLIILRVADLAAALLDSLFEHPARESVAELYGQFRLYFPLPTEFFRIDNNYG